MAKSQEEKLLRLTVYVDETSGEFCHCAGEFYKTCPLRAAHDLPCTDAFVRVTPIIRDEKSSEANVIIRSIDKELRKLNHSIRDLKKIKY